MRVVNDPAVRWIGDAWVGDGWATAERHGGPDPVFGFLRIPFDYAVSHRPGARFGPRAILEALHGFTLYCTDKRVPLEHTTLLDLGEVDVVHSLSETYESITESVAKIPFGVHPVFLGGDHSVTDPIVRGLQRREPSQRFGLIVFDAHLDSRPPTPGKEHSGHWMKTLEDVVDHSTTAQFGISAPIYSGHYLDIARAHGILVRTPFELRRAGWAAAIEEALEQASRGTDGVYVSVDIDVIDQAFAPGTSVPNPAGLLAAEVIDAVFEISRSVPVVGIDVTEVSPPLDRDGATANVAAHIVLNHLAGVSARRAGAGSE